MNNNCTEHPNTWLESQGENDFADSWLLSWYLKQSSLEKTEKGMDWRRNQILYNSQDVLAL